MRLAQQARLGLIVTLAALIGLLSGTVTLVGQGSFAATGDLGTGRTGHTATLLDDGRVFVAGGFGGALLSSTEIYDPATGVFSAGSSLSNTLVGHRAVKLPDGRVLIVGGFDGASATTAADLFDPSTGTITAAAAMTTPRSDASVTLLPDGTVLVAGGFSGGTSITDTAEIYDPASDTWTLTGSMTDAREAHTATLLPDGTVLVAGGQGDLPSETVRASSEIYDPAAGTFAAVGAMGTGRYFHTATFLPAADLVLVAGGLTAFDLTALTASVEVYDPLLGVWASLPDLLAARQLHTASLLPDESILFFGGDASTGPGSVERYDPAVVLAAAQAVEVADAILDARNSLSATTLADGSVLIAGGDDAGSTFYVAAEIYTPDAVEEPPVDEPPVDEPPVDEPPVDEPPVDEPPALTFADFADLPIPGLTIIAIELPPGLSLVSLTGIIPLLAAIEAAELSAAQGDTPIDTDGGDLIFEEGLGNDDLSTFLDEQAIVGIDIVVREAMIGVEKAIDLGTGNSFDPKRQIFLNLLETVGVGPLWVFAPTGGWVFDAFWSDEQVLHVPPRADRSSPFVPTAYTGSATAPPNLAALGLDPSAVPAVFVWNLPTGAWDTFRPNGLAILQTADRFVPGDALVTLILNERPLDLHIARPDQTFGERCESVLVSDGRGGSVIVTLPGFGDIPPLTDAEALRLSEAILFLTVNPFNPDFAPEAAAAFTEAAMNICIQRLLPTLGG